MSQHWLAPDWEPKKTIQHLSIKYLTDKGIKAILLDVDKTILPGKSLDIHPSIDTWIKEGKNFFLIHLLSNNPSRIRISSVAKALKLSYTFSAAKPRRKKLHKFLDEFNLSPSEVAIIGDRIFTDVLAGNRLGLYTVLVRPIGENGNETDNQYLQKAEKTLANLLGAEIL